MTDPTIPNQDPTDESGLAARRWWIAGGALVAAALVIILVIVLVSDDGGDDSSVVVDPSSTTSTSTTQPPTTTTTAPPAGAPSVAAFTANPSPVSCPGNATEPVTLAWQTREAVSASVEVDGVPQTTPPYPPEGSIQAPFNCAAPQHNYTLVVNGINGTQVRQQLTVQRSVPPTQPPTTQPPTTQPPTTQPPPSTTTTTNEGPTTTTTIPAVANVDITFDDEDDPDQPMTLTAVPAVVGDDGKVIFQLENNGQLQHTFTILQTDTPYDQLPVDPDTNQVSTDDQVGQTITIKPGKTKTYKINLKIGSFVLLDNQPGFYAQGARAAFTVVNSPED